MTDTSPKRRHLFFRRLKVCYLIWTAGYFVVEHSKTRPGGHIVCEHAVSRQSKQPTLAQLQFAKALGIEVSASDSGADVSRKIRREVNKRNRQAIREWQPKVGELLAHPQCGPCQIERIGDSSLKITLLVLSTNQKKVVNAMKLFECYRIVDGRN